MFQQWLLPDVRGPSIAELWQRLEAHLGAHAPYALGSLNPAASEERLREAAKVLGGDLPPDLAESLRIHDGQPGTTGRPPHPIPLVPALFDPLRRNYIATWGELAPLDLIIVSSRSRHGSGEVLPLESLGGGESDGHTLRDNRASWVVFVDPGSGDVLALDIAPPPGGRHGQVVAIDHDPARLVVLAPSYRAWFEELVTRYESGRYIIAGKAGAPQCAIDREAPVRD
jgi:cell wall assembly regulator SMI1